METKFYSDITSVEVILPEETPFEDMHKAQVDMAYLGSAKDAQKGL